MRARKRISRERSAREQGEAAARASDRTIFILTYSTLTYAAAPPACLARRALRLSPLARARGVDRPPHRSNARATAPHALVSRARVGPRESGREGRKREREKGGKNVPVPPLPASRRAAWLARERENHVYCEQREGRARVLALRGSLVAATTTHHARRALARAGPYGRGTRRGIPTASGTRHRTESRAREPVYSRLAPCVRCARAPAPCRAASTL